MARFLLVNRAYPAGPTQHESPPTEQVGLAG